MDYTFWDNLSISERRRAQVKREMPRLRQRMPYIAFPAAFFDHPEHPLYQQLEQNLIAQACTGPGDQHPPLTLNETIQTMHRLLLEHDALVQTILLQYP